MLHMYEGQANENQDIETNGEGDFYVYFLIRQTL